MKKLAEDLDKGQWFITPEGSERPGIRVQARATAVTYGGVAVHVVNEDGDFWDESYEHGQFVEIKSA